MTLRPTQSLFAEADRERLRKILRDPLVSLAIDVAIRQAQPDATSLAKLKPEQQASIANQLAGMTELVRRLDALAQPTQQLDQGDNPSDLGEWDHEDEEEQPTN